jgi:hypothetical protein
MNYQEMVRNDVITLVLSIIVAIESILIYRIVRGYGWALMVLGWLYMLFLRGTWLHATINENTNLKETLGSNTIPHWSLVVLALGIFYFDVKKLLKR